MLYLNGKYKLNSSILSIGANKHNIILLDSSYNIYEFNKDQFIFTKKIFDFKNHHPFSKACAVSMQGYIAIGIPKSNICEVFHLENGNLKHIKTLEWHKADIYNIRFSRDGKFLITGGEDGKVFLFRLPDFNVVNILPPRPDYISNIHFGRVANFIVYSSYDLQNCVFDMEQNKIIGTFKTNSVVEDIVFFDDDKKIFCVCSNGDSGIYNITNKTLDLKHNYDEWLTRAGLSKDDNYAYIGSRKNILSYLDLATHSPKYQVDLELEYGIASMRVVDAKLHIGYSNGYLHIFDLTKFENEMQNAIKNKDYKNAKIISDKNISLKTHKVYIDFMDNTFDELFEKAKMELQKDSSNEAINDVINELEAFFEDDVKKQKFSSFIQNIGIFKEFNNAILNRDYALAYKIAEENNVFKNTSEFEKLEDIYHQIFESAKNILINESQESINKANALLKPFINIASKKDSINSLLRNASKFNQADLLVKNKHFGEFFKLAEHFKEIQHTKTYKKTMILGEQILATINELESEGKYNKALELNEILKQFTPFSTISNNKKDEINLKIEFLELYNKKAYNQIYKSIDKFELLKGSAEYINISNHFNKIFDNAFDCIINNNYEMAYKILQQCFNIPFWKNRLDNIFNISYLNEIEKNINNNEKNINWQLTLESYINMFGKNDELIKICTKNEEVSKILNMIEVKEGEIKYMPSIIL